MAYVLKFKSDYPNMVDNEVIGKTLEGRDLYVIKVHSPGAINPNKPGLWINSCQHAREWVTNIIFNIGNTCCRY
jgi:carboxypeptidase T